MSNVLKEKRNLSPIKKINKEKNISFESSQISDLKEGLYVKHPTFGKGKIINLNIDTNQNKATVKFNHVGEKTLLLNFAKLKILK